MKWIILDFGSRRIKTLLIAQEGQRLTIEDFHMVDVKPGYFKGLAFPEPAAWAAVTIALNELEWLKPEEDHVVLCALPSAYLETRYLKFPFKSEKKIEKVLQFELESTIPFDLDEIQIRSLVLEGDGVSALKKESLVLAMAYRRDAIKQVESELKKFQLSNPAITVQILALAALKTAISEPSVFGILEIGHSKSDFLLASRSTSLLAAKTFWWGGRNLLQAIQEELEIDEQKAEHILTHMDPEKPLMKGMKTSAKSFITEIRQSFKNLQNAGIQLPKPFVIYTFGRPSKNLELLTQIESGLKSEFEVQFQPFPFPQLRSRNLQGFERIKDLESSLPALSIALAQSRTHRGKIPSFSETGFQFQQNLKKLKTGSFSFMKRAAALLIAPFIYALLQIGVQKKENAALLSSLPQILRGTAFEPTADETTDDIVLKLKKELASNRIKIGQLQENEKSPLAVLTQISKALPTHLKIDVREFKVTTATIFLSAETTGTDTAQKLIDSLKTLYPKLKAGSISSCSTAQKADCKSFSIEVERDKT